MIHYHSLHYQVDCWVDWSTSTLKTSDDDKFAAALDELNSHLRLRTSLVGHDIGLADACVWATLARTFFSLFLTANSILIYSISFDSLGWDYFHK
jgi:glutathione S-transferase